MDHPSIRAYFSSKPNMIIHKRQTILERRDSRVTITLDDGEVDPLMASVLVGSGAFQGVKESKRQDKPPPGITIDAEKKLQNQIDLVRNGSGWGGTAEKADSLMEE